MAEPQVLIVDDSAVVRGLLARIIEGEPALRLAGTAMHGQSALDILRRQPIDLVVMDVEMPVMDGIQTLRRMVQDYPAVKVVMASTHTTQGAELTVEALRIGAAACIAKPVTSSLSASIQQVSEELLPILRSLAARRESRGLSPGETSARSLPPRETQIAAANAIPNRGARPFIEPKILVIGSSTGGPRALSTFLGSLPENFPLPIAIVQHMPATFTPILARHLEADGRRPCHEATQRMPIEAGHTYLAPGGLHLEIDAERGRPVCRLHEGPPEHFCRPAVNPLFRSAAARYPGGVVAVVLTGMGEDGTDGARSVRERGGVIVVQDEATSVVWGMPGSVVRAELHHACLPIERIGPHVLQLVSRKGAHDAR